MTKGQALTHRAINTSRAQRQADAFLSTHSESRDLTRVIVHVDMDAFYAAVEEKDDPSLKVLVKSRLKSKIGLKRCYVR